MQLKEPVVSAVPIETVLAEGIEVDNPHMTVNVVDRRRCHVAKTSWGWAPSFQAVPSELPFDGQEFADEFYEISSVADIRGYIGTGDYEIVDECGVVISWKEFERRVIGWESYMAEHGFKGKVSRHDEKASAELGSFTDPLGYQFCRRCFC